MQDEAAVKKTGWSALILSVLTALVGAALIVDSARVQQLMALIIAALCAVLGIYHLIVYFVSQRKNSMLATDLFIGVILVVLGVFLYIRRADVMNYITYIFGLLLIVDCIMAFQNAIFVKRIGYLSSLPVLFFGLLMLVFGVLLFVNPDFIQSSLLLISGIFLAAAGAFGIISFIFLQISLHKVKKNGKIADRITAEEIDHTYTDADYTDVPAAVPESTPSDTPGRTGSSDAAADASFSEIPDSESGPDGADSRIDEHLFDADDR